MKLYTTIVNNNIISLSKRKNNNLLCCTVYVDENSNKIEQLQQAAAQTENLYPNVIGVSIDLLTHTHNEVITTVEA